ncbi:hypothetical protein ARTSIC4J27_2064 [Pseudarthrobacter siccitolerans]|uniref:Transmembrane protein n=1 Tax=Pseudarthrobacter siccitolerans TaxID=861266 RepID=A0A024H2V8_9MICC|nr:hypothetical protein ARTSIC4J27_2064 [Pseudarthrobacter siccitolerans]
MGILLVLVFLVPPIFSQAGHCVDYAPGKGTSYCESGPVLGVAGSVLFGVVYAALILFCLYRIVRILVHRRRLRQETRHGRE